MNQERSWHSITRVQNEIYCGGGFDIDDNPSKSTEIYSLDLDEWKKGSEMICSGYATLVSVKEFIYSFGGSM